MRVVVLGAGGGTGAHVVRLAAALGHEVVAVARRPLDLPAGVAQVVGDATSRPVVEQALQGADAVISCLGVTRGSAGRPSAAAAEILVQALPPGARVVSVAGAGIDVPGDRKGRGARAVSLLTRTLAGDVFRDKQEEHDVLAASALDYTVVRPPRLVDGDPGPPGRLTDEAPGPTARALPRGTLAATMVRLAVEGGRERSAPFVVR